MITPTELSLYLPHIVGFLDRRQSADGRPFHCRRPTVKTCKCVLEIARIRAHFVAQNSSFAQWARAQGYVYQTVRLACQGKRRSAAARKIVEQLQQELAS